MNEAQSKDTAKSIDNARESTQQNCAMAQLPLYLCHKKVWALKITNIERDVDRAKVEDRETDGSALLHHSESYLQPVRVDHAYMTKHKPEVGGYYVVYDDGYKSFSPAKAFEDGYTKL